MLQAPPPTLNQSATAAAAAATATAAAAAAAAILSMAMALAANMKYHTAKPFSMNIKFRLTISISCTNVSVTKFALGLGQLGRDRQAKWGAERGTARPGLDCCRGVRKSQEINSIAKLCQCKSLHNISLSQYLWPQLCFKLHICELDWTNRSSGPCFSGGLRVAFGLGSDSDFDLALCHFSSFLTVSCGCLELSTQSRRQRHAAFAVIMPEKVTRNKAK